MTIGFDIDSTKMKPKFHGSEHCNFVLVPESIESQLHILTIQMAN